MIHRFREQARSHIEYQAYIKSVFAEDQMWERACSRRRQSQTPNQADLAMINPVSLAASNRIATNFDVGVWLPSPVLSSGTSGFTSG